MKKFDITLLTDPRYYKPKIHSAYIDNVLLEDQMLSDSLSKLGLRVNRLPWSATDNNWADSKFAVFRSTWDYFDKIKEFRRWMLSTAPKTLFINPLNLLEWNLDKHYLQDLQNRGIDIPPTKFVEPGSQSYLEEAIREQGWEEVVLKPAIAAAGRHTYRFKVHDAKKHEQVYHQLIRNEAMLIQEFQTSVPQRGEVALIYFNGIYSHAVLKRAKPGDFRVQDDFGGTVHGYNPTDTEMALGTKAIASCDPVPVYARVDIIEDNSGKPVLTELELIEPELWLRKYPVAADTFAKAIADYASSSLSARNR